jgi:hypothetical protein
MSKLSPSHMREKTCHCGQVSEEVINAEEKKRTGWYCPTCKRFEKAILRERVWRGDDN